MGFVTDGLGNLTNVSGVNPHEGHEVHGSPYAILFIFTACCIGAIVRQVMKGWPIPYTVVLIILGMCFGAISGTYANVKKYTNMATEDPHLILTTFLPVLLFESAFAMDVHIFYRMFSQILILAIFGLVVATLLSGVMAKMVFTYNWTWFEALLFGAVISATDPVAVVALLNDLGAPKQLSTIIEGESLLNDGMAIVLYKIFFNLSFSSMTGVEIGLYFPRVALGGFVFGLVVGKVTVFWLQHVFNDAMVEITITLAATYLTFYIGEEVLGISGVLAVVMLGIEINQQKTSISPEVEAFLHRFWEMLAYLANTLIFIMVGVVIMEKALTILENNDPFLIIVDYLGVTVIRALVLIAFSPVLVHTGYGLNWQNGVVIMWGGLRGAVGLALALQVAIDHPEVGGKLLIHTAGIVMFTLLLNATTMKKLLEKLGMSEISDSKKIAMANGVRRVRESNDRTLKMLKSDRFLADADWTLADKYCIVHNPYMEYEGEHEETPVLIRHSTCPNCETSVPNEPSAKEFKEMSNDGRIRVIKAQKISYWKQFEHGMLSREAVQVLTALADVSMDEPDSFIEAVDLQPFWKVPPTLQKLKDKLQALCQTKSADRIPTPTNRIQLMMYHIAVHFMFDVVMHSLIILNLIPIIMEMTADDSAWYIGILRIVNYVFTTIYCLEAIWKICAFREFYFKDYWNLLDLLIVFLSLIDIVIDESADGATEGFSSNILKVSKVFRFLRMGRVLRLLKTVLPKMINALNNIINRKLSLGYDVGKGHIVAQEEVLKLIDHMVVDKRISRDLKAKTEQNRLDIVKSLGMLQREHPGIGISVKTRQAIRTILNNGRDVIQELKGGGLLDETEAARLEAIVEVKMKQQLSAPPSIPPPQPETLLRNVLWLEDMEEEVKDSIASVAEMRVFDFGETITRQGDEVDGIYLIISGMIKMIGVSVSKKEKSREQLLLGDDISHGDMMVTTDYLSAGNVMGEWGMLTGIARNSSCTCETSVQAYFMPKKKMLEIMAKYPRLSERMWHVCGVRMAVPLLMEEPAYHNWTKDKIRLMCERSYIARVPPPGPSGTFSTTEQMKEVVLIQGRLTCVETRETHEGPCVLPRTYRLFKVHFDLEPKVLIIVRKNSIMPISDDEEMADMQDQPSAADLLGIRVSQQQMAHSTSRHSAIGALVMKTVRSTSMAPQTTVRHRGNSFEQVQQERTRRNTMGSQGPNVGIGEGLRNRIPDPLPDTYPGPRHILVAPSPVRGFHEDDVDETHDDSR